MDSTEGNLEVLENLLEGARMSPGERSRTDIPYCVWPKQIAALTRATRAEDTTLITEETTLDHYTPLSMETEEETIEIPTDYILPSIHPQPLLSCDVEGVSFN